MPCSSWSFRTSLGRTRPFFRGLRDDHEALLIDLARSPVRYLPKWAWVLICLASIPLGGIIYLTVGRRDRQ